MGIAYFKSSLTQVYFSYLAIIIAIVVIIVITITSMAW